MKGKKRLGLTSSIFQLGNVAGRGFAGIQTAGNSNRISFQAYKNVRSNRFSGKVRMNAYQLYLDESGIQDVNETGVKSRKSLIRRKMCGLPWDDMS